MSSFIRISTDSSPASSGTQDITVPNFGTPKGAMFIYGFGAFGSTANGVEFGVSFTDGDTSYGHFFDCQNNQASSDTWREYFTIEDLLIKSYNLFTTVPDASGFFDQWIDNGVRLNWTESISNIPICTILFGGSDTQVKVGEFELSTNGSETNVSGVGFEPDAIFFLTGAAPSIEDSRRDDARLSFGFSSNEDTIKNGSILYQNLDASTTTNVASRINNNRAGQNAFGTATFEVTEFNASGFKVTTRDGDANGFVVYYLAVKFSDNIKTSINFIDTPDSTGNYSLETGFKPQFALQLQTDNTSYNSNFSTDNCGSIGIGLFDAQESQATISIRSDDGAATSVERTTASNSNVSELNLTDTTDGASFTSTLSSIDDNGYTLNFSEIGSASGSPSKWISISFETNAVSGNLDLSISGSAGSTEISDSIDLFTSGRELINNNIDLFIDAKDNVSDSIDLFTNGNDELNNNFDLFIDGNESINNDINLFIRGHKSTHLNRKIYIASSFTPGFLRSYNLDGSEEEIILDNIDLIAIELDDINQKIYWKELGNNIKRSNIDGSNIENISNNASGNVVDLHLDLFNEKVYWAKSDTPGHIKRINFDSSQEEIVISGFNCEGVFVDSDYNNKIYFSNRSSSRIQKSNLDGSNIELVKAFFSPRGFDIDLDNNYIYYGDATNLSLKRINLDGTGEVALFSGDGVVQISQIKLDLLTKTLYWRDAQNNTVIASGSIDGSSSGIFKSYQQGVSSLAIEPPDVVNLSIHGRQVINQNIDLSIFGNEIVNNNIDLFIDGKNQENNDINLFIHGHEQINNNLNLFVNGNDRINNDIDLSILGRDSKNNNINLFINGNQDASDSLDLITVGHQSLNNNINLFIEGFNVNSQTIDLFINGKNTQNNNIDLSINGHESISQTLDLLINGKDSISDNIDLFINGNNLINNNLDLFVDGLNQQNQSLNLFINGKNQTDNNVDLIINGHASSVESLDLFINVLDIITGDITLFISSLNIQDNSLDLFVHGIDSFSNNIDLFVGGNQTTTDNIDLVIIGKDTVSNNIDLIIFGANTQNNDLDLFVDGHDQVNNNIDLFVDGFGLINNNTDLFISSLNVLTDSLNLFVKGIDRQSQSIDLFINGSIQISNNIDLFIKGSQQINNNIDLIIIGNQSIDNNLDLFVKADIQIDNNIDLFVDGHAQIDNNLDISVNGSNSLNNNIDLFVSGAQDLVTNDIDLFISGSGIFETSGNVDLFITSIGSIDDNIDLFIHGIIDRPSLVCPPLDPTLPIQIGSDIIDIYQSRIDSLINQLGKNIILEFNPVRSSCRNCVFDTIRNRSAGIYKSGGPRPFPRGRQCPWCKGIGFEFSQETRCIKGLIKFNPKDMVNYNLSIQNSKNIIRVKTFLHYADDIKKTKTAIIDSDQQSIVINRSRLIKGPVPVGLREDRYCVSFWEMI